MGKAHTVGGGAHHEDRPAAGAETPTGGGCAMAREGREGGCTRNRGCARCRAEKSARAGCRAEAEKRARERGAGRRARAREKGGKESGARGKEDVAAAQRRGRKGIAAQRRRWEAKTSPGCLPTVPTLKAHTRAHTTSPCYQPMSQEISPQISQPWNLVVYVQVGRLIAISLRLIGRPEF